MIKEENLFKYFQLIREMKLDGVYNLETDSCTKISKVTDLDVDLNLISDYSIVVCKDNKFGHLRPNGEFIGRGCIYDFIDDFYNDVAIFKLDDKYGVIDKNGNIIVHNIYDHIDSFIEYDLTTVRLNNKYGLIHKDGSIFGKGIVYEDVHIYKDVVIVRIQNKSIIMDLRGNILKKFDTVLKHIWRNYWIIAYSKLGLFDMDKLLTIYPSICTKIRFCNGILELFIHDKIVKSYNIGAPSHIDINTNIVCKEHLIYTDEEKDIAKILFKAYNKFDTIDNFKQMLLKFIRHKIDDNILNFINNISTESIDNDVIILNNIIDNNYIYNRLDNMNWYIHSNISRHDNTYIDDTIRDNIMNMILGNNLLVNFSINSDNKVKFTIY